MSRVTCHLSPVTCHMSHVKIFFLQKKKGFFVLPKLNIKQSGGAGRCRVCYQGGLPSLVFNGMFKSSEFSISVNILFVIAYVLQTRCSRGFSTITFVTHLLIHSLADPFPKNLQNIIALKP